MENEQSQTTLDQLEPIESKGTDFSEFEGVKSTIAKAEVIEINSYYSEEGKKIQEPRKVKALRVESNVITTIDASEGGKIEIRASELFNLISSPKTNRMGWSKNPKAKLNNFLKKLNVSHPKDLVGKMVTIRLRNKENPDGSEQEFLGFVL